MQQPYEEKLSQFIDDDLERSEALELLTTLQQRSELQAKLRRYALTQHALKHKQVVAADLDFAAKIRHELENEPLYLLPRQKLSQLPTAKADAPTPHTSVVKPLPVHTSKPLRPKVLGFSMVAAIIMAVVIMPSIMNSMTEEKVIMMSHQERIQEEYPNEVRLYPVNRRFQDYLQAHNNSLYANGEISVHNRAQYVTYEGE